MSVWVVILVDTQKRLTLTIRKVLLQSKFTAPQTQYGKKILYHWAYFFWEVLMAHNPQSWKAIFSSDQSNHKSRKSKKDFGQQTINKFVKPWSTPVSRSVVSTLGSLMMISRKGWRSFKVSDLDCLLGCDPNLVLISWPINDNFWHVRWPWGFRHLAWNSTFLSKMSPLRTPPVCRLQSSCSPVKKPWKQGLNTSELMSLTLYHWVVPANRAWLLGVKNRAVNPYSYNGEGADYGLPLHSWPHLRSQPL